MLTEDDSQGFVARNETKLAAGILGLFLLIGLLVATRSPTVFQDEPMFCDPGANLALGHGFTSTMWGQPRDALFSGNASLYPALLGIWLKIVGFGFFQARIFNTLLAAIGAFLIWAGIRNARLIGQSWLRLLSLCLVLSGSNITISFRHIRPDSTMFVLCSIVFFACCLQTNRPWKYLLAAVAAAGLVPTGLSMGPYIAVLGFLTLVFYGRRWVSWLFAIGMGMAAGIGIMALIYSHFAAWKTFLGQVLTLTSVSTYHQDSFLHSKIFGPAPGFDNIFTCFFGNPLVVLDKSTLCDYSAVLLFLTLCLLGAKAWKTAESSDRRFLIYAVLITLIVPIALHFTGHYRSFYRWMTYVPLCISVPKLLEVHLKSQTPTVIPKVAIGFMAFSLLLGVPARTSVAFIDWSNRSVRPLTEAASALAKPDDIALVDFRAYFAFRTRVQLLYAYGLTARGDFDCTFDLPTNHLSLLCLQPGEIQTITNRIGGNWEKIPPEKIPNAEELAKTRYAMVFYRRHAEPE
jgi:hypothetical protein